MYVAIVCSRQIDEQLPDIIWCQEPFMEALSKIVDTHSFY